MAFACGLVVLFKFTDALSAAMTAPFVIDLGFTRNEYAASSKASASPRACRRFAGGFIARAYPLATSFMDRASVQAAANLSFSCWRWAGAIRRFWRSRITVENFTAPSHRDVRSPTCRRCARTRVYTATQYALLTALAAVGRTYLSAGAGFSPKHRTGRGFS